MRSMGIPIRASFKMLCTAGDFVQSVEGDSDVDSSGLSTKSALVGGGVTAAAGADFVPLFCFLGFFSILIPFLIGKVALVPLASG